MKSLNMLSKRESIVTAKRLILGSQTLMMTVPKVGQKFSHVMLPHMYLMTAYEGAQYEKNFKIELVQ